MNFFKNYLKIFQKIETLISTQLKLKFFVSRYLYLRTISSCPPLAMTRFFRHNKKRWKKKTRGWWKGLGSVLEKGGRENGRSVSQAQSKSDSRVRFDSGKTNSCWGNGTSFPDDFAEYLFETPVVCDAVLTPRINFRLGCCLQVLSSLSPFFTSWGLLNSTISSNSFYPQVTLKTRTFHCFQKLFLFFFFFWRNSNIFNISLKNIRG